MRTRMFFGLILVFSATSWTADKIQPLNLKLSLRRLTTTPITTKQIPIPEEALAELTPEQRFRMEERMKASASDGTTETIRKQCVARARLAKGTIFGQDRKSPSLPLLPFGRRTKVQPLNVKVGLWVLTTTETASGELPIPARLLEKLTPEQRARIEDRIKAKSSEPPRMTTREHCLTKEELTKGVTFGEDRKSCTFMVLTSTRNKLEMRIECLNPGQDIKSQGTLQVEAIDSKGVKGSIRRTALGDHTADTTSKFTAKWIGPSCGPAK